MKYARTDDRKPPLRRHVNWTVCDRISKRTCLHIDGWLYQLPDDELYFVMETRRGGWDVLNRRVLHATPSGLVPVTEYPDMFANAISRRIDDPWSRKYAPWLAGLHRTFIQPYLHDDAAGFVGFRSILLRYVFTSPKLNDPFEGIPNLYGISGRAERDEARMTAQRREEQQARKAVHEWREGVGKPVAATWSAADRSRLRTLQKLLD